MGLSAYTRIVLIPSNEDPSREFGVSRPVIVVLTLLVLALLAMMVLLMISFAAKHDERAQISSLEDELAEARATIGIASELAVELESMKLAQEKLLFMLGVEQAASSDSLGAFVGNEPVSAAEGMNRAAAMVLNPGPSRWPSTGLVTQEFITGNRARGTRPHLGIDVAGPLDSPILATAEGTVFRTGEDEYLGNFVEIQHGLGYLTVYGHCNRVAVHKGDKVDGGQVIAYMGTSGQSTAVHLHFEVWRQGEAVDPRSLLVGDPARN